MVAPYSITTATLPKCEAQDFYDGSWHVCGEPAIGSTYSAFHDETTRITPSASPNHDNVGAWLCEDHYEMLAQLSYIPGPDDTATLRVGDRVRFADFTGTIKELYDDTVALVVWDDGNIAQGFPIDHLEKLA